jgi:peptide/nickel transport system substrate-binding protein
MIVAQTGSASRLATPTIDRNATIKVGYQYGASVTTLDPPFIGPSDSPFVYPIYDRLLENDVLLSKLRPGLASSWTFSKDGHSLTFNLRHDVKFHDGSPVTAAAVAANIMREKTIQGSRATVALASIGSVTVVSKFVVRLNLVGGGGANLPDIFAGTLGSIINPKFFNANLAAAPPAGAGSGPYVFSSEPTAATEFIFTRAPGKPWQPGTGNAATLIVYSFNTSAAGINDVQAGSLNVAQVALDGVRQGVKVIQSSGGKFAGTPYASLYSVSLILNPKVAPFTNPLYRKAVQAAINPRVVDAGEGDACAVDQQPVAPGSSTYDPNFKNTNPYNVAKAKAYLAQAGVPNGFSFDMPTPNFSNFTTSGQIYQAELAKVGIKANIVPIDPASFVSTLYGGKWPAFVYGGAPGVPDPVSGLFPNLLVGGPNITGGSPYAATANSFYQTLSNPKNAATKRTAEFHKLYAWLNDSGIYLTMCAQQALYIHTNNVVNVQPRFPSAIEDPQFYAIKK